MTEPDHVPVTPNSAYDAIQIEQSTITGWWSMRLTLTCDQLVNPDLMEDLGEAEAKRLMLPLMLEGLNEQLRVAQNLIE